MNKASDARIPIVIGGNPGPDDACLVEDGQDMPKTGYAVRFALAAGKPGHITGCACCTLRGPAADALGAMFLARARGASPFFNRVVILASPAGEAAILDALTEDVVIQARYRLAPPRVTNT
jgi:hypothetical protein